MPIFALSCKWRAAKCLSLMQRVAFLFQCADSCPITALDKSVRITGKFPANECFSSCQGVIYCCTYDMAMPNCLKRTITAHFRRIKQLYIIVAVVTEFSLFKIFFKLFIEGENFLMRRTI